MHAPNAIALTDRVQHGGAAADDTTKDGVNAVQVLNVVSDPTGTRLEYEPGHPDANEQGYVAYPNVNVMREMVDLISATRAYEANVTAINSSKDMALRALQIGRV